MSGPLFIGVDLGTSGARAVIINSAGNVVAKGQQAFQSKTAARDPKVWWQCVESALKEALCEIEAGDVTAICASATSGTVMAVDDDLAPLRDVFMYNDPCPDEETLKTIRNAAPDWSPAKGATGGLGCVLTLLAQQPYRVLHQADWINYHLTDRWVGDGSSALKSGFDPMDQCWPSWLEKTAFKQERLAETYPVGESFGLISRISAQRFGLADNVKIIAGTTDGCASFLATGADKRGDGVTVLGTTLTIKLLSDAPIFSPQAGVYSHRIGDLWLAGGASNTGGGALLKYFSADELKTLSEKIDPSSNSGLDYYPLQGKGERFPVSDPEMEPRETPRPKDDVIFLQGLLEGIATIEATAYGKLADLGAPPVGRVFTVGGGTKNLAWTEIRSKALGVPHEQPLSTDAAYGSALLARRGAGA